MNVLLIAIQTKIGSLQIRINPEWRTKVDEDDREYLSDLFLDISRRIDQDRGSLFEQLSHLSVGPLITTDYGENFELHLSLFQKWDDFAPLK